MFISGCVVRRVPKIRNTRTGNQKNRSELQDCQQLAQMRGNLLDQVSQDLRNPLSNINMAICMLKQVNNEKDRDKYLLILQQECKRQIEILNEMSSLQELLTDENAKLLRTYKLLGKL